MLCCPCAKPTKAQVKARQSHAAAAGVRLPGSIMSIHARLELREAQLLRHTSKASQDGRERRNVGGVHCSASGHVPHCMHGLVSRYCLALGRAVRHQAPPRRPAGPISSANLWWWSKTRMPPRKKKAPAKADVDEDEEDFVDDGAIDDGDDDAPTSKKRKAPKKATPKKTKPIEEPHIAP